MGEALNACQILEMHMTFVVNWKTIYYLEELVINGRIILKYILKKQGVNMWTRFNWLNIDS